MSYFLLRRICLDKTDYRNCRYPFAPAAESHSLGCGGLYVYLAGKDLEDIGKPFLHTWDVGRQFRHFSNNSVIKVIYPVTFLFDQLHNLSQQYSTINILISRIIIREMGADIPHCQGTEYCIDNGMYQDIRVGVS